MPGQPQTSIPFSVVIPCHNDSVWLPRSVASAARQTFAPLEIIIIDDGSTDATPDVCAQLAEEHPLLRVHRQPNAGVSASRNQGIALAQGSHLVFLDADDELKPEALGIYQGAIRSSGAEWLIGSSEWERDGRVRSRTPVLPASREARFRQFMDKSLHLGNISNMCFARDLFEALRFPEQHRFGEDLVVFAVLLARTDPQVLAEVTALQHRRPDSLRNQATFDERAESTVPATVFAHPLLPAAYAQYAGTYWARHSRSIMKRAYKGRQYAEVIHWYREMIKADPRLALNPKWTWRYLRARLATNTDDAEKKES